MVAKASNLTQLTNIEARCAEQGMRMTEQRRTIARVLNDSDDHPDVEELYRRCAKIDDRISISTVCATSVKFMRANEPSRADSGATRATCLPGAASPAPGATTTEPEAATPGTPDGAASPAGTASP